jgi:polyisoprenoid-binding protein YceI
MLDRGNPSARCLSGSTAVDGDAASRMATCWTPRDSASTPVMSLLVALFAPSLAKVSRPWYGRISIPVVTGITEILDMQLSLVLGLPAALIAVAVATSSPQTAPAAKPAAAASSASAMTYSVDGTHSCALFRIQHLGAGQFWGRFNEVSGSFTGGAASAEGMAFNITVQVASVDTRTKQLDDHLRSPDFFNAVEFPTMTFKSTSVKATGGAMFDVTGDFTMLGKTKSVTAKVEFTGAKSNPAPMGDRAGYEATLTLKRSDFGMSYGVANGALGDEVRVVVNLEGTKK